MIATRLTDPFRDDVVERIPLGAPHARGASYITGQVLDVAGGVTYVMG